MGNGTVVVYWENYDFSRVSVREQALYAHVYTVTYTHTRFEGIDTVKSARAQKKKVNPEPPEHILAVIVGNSAEEIAELEENYDVF